MEPLELLWLMAGCAKLEGFRMATLQRGFLQGAYSEHKSMRYLQQKLQHSDAKLGRWKGRKGLSKHAGSALAQGEAIAGGSMAKLPPSAAARAAGGSSVPSSLADSPAAGAGWGSYLRKRAAAKPEIAEGAKDLLKHASCPTCRLPKGHPGSHRMPGPNCEMKG